MVRERREGLVLLSKLTARVFTSIFQIQGVQTILQTFPAAKRRMRERLICRLTLQPKFSNTLQFYNRSLFEHVSLVFRKRESYDLEYCREPDSRCKYCFQQKAFVSQQYVGDISRKLKGSHAE